MKTKLHGMSSALVLLGALSAQAAAQTTPGPTGEVAVIEGVRSEAPSAPAPEWGTAEYVLVRIGAAEFTPYDSITTYAYGNAGYRYLTAGSWLDAKVQVPAGSLVSYVYLEGYDNDATNDMSVVFFSCPAHDGSDCTSYTPAISSGTPGYFYTVGTNLGTTLTIKNAENYYFVRVSMPSGTNSLMLRSVYIWYKLQVSPAPVAATFTDVPTSHALFRFVEALSRSGITGGCGGSNFCPDSPLTRGQMAVFLATALGLHWQY